jgi:hypothetical protein
MLDTIDDEGLDLDALLEAQSSAGGGRRAYQLYVDSFHCDGGDPSQHFLVGRRADPLDEAGGAVRVFLEPVDSADTISDPNRQRPSIESFAWPDYAAALEAGDLGTIAALSDDNVRTRIFTRPGGMMLAEVVKEHDSGDLAASWLFSLKQGTDDAKHSVMIAQVSIRKRPTAKGSFEAEILRDADAVITTNFDELRVALLDALSSVNQAAGMRAAYLRLRKPDGSIMIPEGNSTSRGRIDLRDRKVGAAYVARRPEDGVAEFLGTPLGQQLNKPWGPFEIEVIPVCVVPFGGKSAERRDPSKAYNLGEPDGPGGLIQRPAQAVNGYALSTVRLKWVETDPERGYFLATLAMPVTGELFRLTDVATSNWQPAAEPQFATFQSQHLGGGAAVADAEDLPTKFRI